MLETIPIRCPSCDTDLRITREGMGGVGTTTTTRCPDCGYSKAFKK